MPDAFSLIKIDGKIIEPATELIRKISDAIGGGFKPRQIRRVARAQADARIIEAKAQIKINELERRALTRFIAEESKKQNNIESIIQKAIGQLNASSKPQDVEDDWITNFFNQCRIVSDEDMQVIWSRILAGESNSPGSYSKRTINFLGSLDKSDAELFMTLCRFTLLLSGARLIPFIFHEDLEQPLYKDNGLAFTVLHHLDAIGLISIEPIGYIQRGLYQYLEISYHDTNIKLEFDKPQDNKFSTGHALLTVLGEELARVCSVEKIDGFIDYVISKISKQGTVVHQQ